jgi:hypothetical protein
MFDVYGTFDEIISKELGVSLEVYQDVIENKCTYWEAHYIITAILNERTDKMDKVKSIFNSHLDNE